MLKTFLAVYISTHASAFSSHTRGIARALYSAYDDTSFNDVLLKKRSIIDI